MKIIIVGGGIAGLYCAYQQLKTDKTLHITVIEANSYLGGRMKTLDVEVNGKKYYLEGGAGVIKEDEKLIIELCKEMKIPVNFWSSTRQIIYHDKGKNINLSNYDYNKIINDLCNNILPNESYIDKLDDLDLDTQQKIGLMIGTTYSEIFNSNGLAACKGVDWNEFLIDDPEIKFGKPKAWSELLESLKNFLEGQGVKILLGEKVIRIRNDYIQTNKSKYLYDKIYITIPYHCLKNINLPQELDSWATLMNYVHKETDYLRIYSYFDKPILISSKICCNLRIRRVIPITPNLIMSVYTDGEDATKIGELKEDDMNLLIQNELSLVLGKDVGYPSKSWIFMWKKGISSWKPTDKSISSMIKFIQNPVTNIYFGGDTYSEYPGSIEGALDSIYKIL